MSGDEMDELRGFWAVLLRGMVLLKFASNGSRPQERVLVCLCVALDSEKYGAAVLRRQVQAQ